MQDNASQGSFAMPAKGVAQVIQQAHERSTAFGLQRHDAADLRPVDADALAWMMARNEALCAHARPVMETLSAQIAGTQSMVVLTDAQGVILHAQGDDEFLGRASRVALHPGAMWSENCKGTNAIGTALAVGEALQVNGYEHFLQANHFLTCSCAPILDPHGHVIGALDVSSDHRSQSPHTMALVRMSAKMVENHLFGRVFEDAVRLRFHARPEFLGTLVEGLAAFAPDGRFLAANRSGQFQLGLSTNALSAHTFSSLFGIPMSTALAHARQSVPQLLSLQLPGGVAVCAQVEFRVRAAAILDSGDDSDVQGRRTCSIDKPAAPRVSALTAPAEQSSLRYLNTGDRQLAQVINRVTRLLGRDVPTLIKGETGTGKELLARAIHHDGPRARKPFMAVNCASIPETLIEAELFGYEEGAFTGARRKGSPGKIVQAHGGTLFLDEIGDMPLSMQARLLRVLQERSVAPLGSARQIDVDVHVVCATHRNLREMMAQGSFREDLYYRLNGLMVRLPALRDRTDMAVIVERLLHTLRSDVLSANALQPVDPEVMSLFTAHHWPGNLRQLNNVLRTSVLMAEGAPVLGREHLPEDFLEECGVLADCKGGMPNRAREAADAAAQGATTAFFGDFAHAGGLPVLYRPLGDITQLALEQALLVHSGNVSAAARLLGVSRNTVYRHLRAARSL